MEKDKNNSFFTTNENWEEYPNPNGPEFISQSKKTKREMLRKKTYEGLFTEYEGLSTENEGLSTEEVNNSKNKSSWDWNKATEKAMKTLGETEDKTNVFLPFYDIPELDYPEYINPHNPDSKFGESERDNSYEYFGKIEKGEEVPNPHAYSNYKYEEKSSYDKKNNPINKTAQKNEKYNKSKTKSTKKNLSKESLLTKSKEFFKKGTCILLIATTLIIAGKTTKKIATHIQTEIVKSEINKDFEKKLIINQINLWNKEEIYKNLFYIYLYTDNDYEIMDMAIKKASDGEYKHFYEYLINIGYWEKDYYSSNQEGYTYRANYKAWENAMEVRELEKRNAEKELEKTSQIKGAK